MSVATSRDDSNENKKAKDMRKCKTKWKLKFKDYENHLQASQVKNEISHLESHKLDVDSLKENLKEFIRSNVFTLKSRKRFRRKKHNIFTQEVNKIVLSTNNDKEYSQLNL